MYLSDRDLKFALATGQLIVSPPPDEIDTTSIDLHLDSIEEARVWNVDAFAEQQSKAGHDPILAVGRFDHKLFSKQFTIPVPVPTKQKPKDDYLVYRDGQRIVIKQYGFLIWQTYEDVGTPELDPRLICFVDGKSSRARAGFIVHMTAPTIHAGWWGKITLEIANLGPFVISLEEGDAIAQIVVAAISSPPQKKKITRGVAIGQRDVTGGDSKAKSTKKKS